MVFKRRKPRTYVEVVSESIYPKGGWARASRYVLHRLRRLPDPAYKISRGIAAGVFVCFTPLFGLHFFLAAAIAVAIRGNIIAALLATFVGNPLTFPIIAAMSMELGTTILGVRGLPLPMVFSAFSDAANDLWSNFTALFSDRVTNWGGIAHFWRLVFLPYLIGGLLPGLLAAAASYFLANPIIAAYQKRRVARMKKRFAKQRERVISRKIEKEKSQALSRRAATE